MHFILDILRNSILITGLVIIMMMMIESLNIESRGSLFSGLRRSRFGQVTLAALLGSIPGCIGGFATVSLYTHRMLSFGALIAMMVASSGDEAFVMLAIMPDTAIWIFIFLFILAIIAGVLTDTIRDRRRSRIKASTATTPSGNGYTSPSGNGYASPAKEASPSGNGHAGSEEAGRRHLGWKRALMFAGVLLFIVALAGGFLEHDHDPHGHQEQNVLGFDLLSEGWMNVLFAVLSIAVLAVLIFAKDHFVEEHLWHHIVLRHFPTIFAWTFGVLLVVGLLMQSIDLEAWISDNTVLMILLATAIGIIPESGPHLIFVTLYASGIVPLPVLLASCVSQDGHSALPLLAERKKSFAVAKLINCVLALAVGFGSLMFF